MRRPSEVIGGHLREVVFGLEDGLVSTLGVVTGIASGTQNRAVIMLSGMVVVTVESLSMAAGTFLSNKTEIDQHRSKFHRGRMGDGHEIDHKHPATDALAMGAAYVIGGGIPVLAYLLTMNVNLGILLSVGMTFVGLFMVGIMKGKMTKTNLLRSGLEMVVVAMGAAGVGWLVGEIVSRILGIRLN